MVIEKLLAYQFYLNNINQMMDQMNWKTLIFWHKGKSLDGWNDINRNYEMPTK
jgi:hypothetical protein